MKMTSDIDNELLLRMVLPLGMGVMTLGSIWTRMMLRDDRLSGEISHEAPNHLCRSI